MWAGDCCSAGYYPGLCRLGVIHVIPAIPACPVRPKSGHSANARVYKYTPYEGGPHSQASR